MATTDRASHACLTLRASTGGDGTNRYEVGIIGHGPDGDHLAAHVADQVRRWNDDHRDRPGRPTPRWP
ncbi:hypothetical protein RB614_11290 [Phytohabitans sp. ZYX-F-186]|uniref:Uncharacterized protein n=1 Tax=Phytohabitans maris TaxID=3071409 RepID=A0ABU0ZFP9_9ACTN|nr:hypothetical protein [Phytohabitans sp. ZYX-F-186]MDQ7905105.1 hypothetical protein [Phytohabitans sp. ZYX-F-186]